MAGWMYVDNLRALGKISEVTVETGKNPKEFDKDRFSAYIIQHIL